MTTQEKFTAALEKLADEREGIELVIDKGWPNVGTFSFEREGEFEPLLVVPFYFNERRCDFSCTGTNMVLGRNDAGGAFAATEGEGYEAVLTRIEEILDGDRPAGETDDDRRLHDEAVARREERTALRRRGK